jgi:hypothetical protein
MGTDRVNSTTRRSRLDEMLLSRFFNLIGNTNPLLNLYSQKKNVVSTLAAELAECGAITKKSSGVL